MFTADSHFWYTRTQNFIESVKTHNWTATYQNPKPGVTVMWLSGISMDAYFSYYQAKHNFVPYIFSSDIFPRLDFMVKAPLVILCLISVLGLYLLIKNIVDEDTAFYSLVFLTFQPFYVGVSRFLHGDGTLTACMTLSVCLLLYYVLKDKRKIFLILCAISGGLAFLSKMQAIYLIPYTCLILLINTYIEKKKLVDLVKKISIWIGIFIATVFILFPALWTNPVFTLTDMYEEATMVTGSNLDANYESLYTNQLVRIFTPLSILFFVIGLAFFFTKVKKQI
jgi:4-amino-4-deoxy-L-arabinose transferase-like glycosyltransferase